MKVLCTNCKNKIKNKSLYAVPYMLFLYYMYLYKVSPYILDATLTSVALGIRNKIPPELN